MLIVNDDWWWKLIGSYVQWEAGFSWKEKCTGLRKKGICRRRTGNLFVKITIFCWSCWRLTLTHWIGLTSCRLSLRCSSFLVDYYRWGCCWKVALWVPKSCFRKLCCTNLILSCPDIQVRYSFLIDSVHQRWISVVISLALMVFVTYL